MIFEDDTKDIQSISSWYEILAWKELPNFGHFHTDGSVDNYKRNYYVSNEILALYKNLLETMKNRFNSANIRLTGDPGSGKTSFIYSLIEQAKLKKDALFNNFVFYNFHINRADGVNFEDEIKFHIKEAWKQYFTMCGLSDDYQRIRQQGLHRKDMINRLTEVFREKKSVFTKILIFIIDDVDLLEEEKVDTVVDAVMKHLEVASVKKWIVLRDVTFENYGASVKAKIEQFFPDPFKFPTISLYELIDFRIKNTSGTTKSPNKNGKNPFSKHLCDDIVLPMCEGNMREGLSLLKTVLEDYPPKKIEKNIDITFVINYLEKASINTFLKSGKLINLHVGAYRSTFLPLSIDILNCALYHSSYNIVYAAVNSASQERNAKAGSIVTGMDKILKIREEDFKHSLDKLAEFRLVKLHGKKRIELTERGRIHAVYSSRDHYFNTCKDKIKYIVDDKLYWRLSGLTLNHERIVRDLMSWEDPNM